MSSQVIESLHQLDVFEVTKEKYFPISNSLLHETVQVMMAKQKQFYDPCLWIVNIKTVSQLHILKQTQIKTDFFLSIKGPSTFTN